MKKSDEENPKIPTIPPLELVLHHYCYPLIGIFDLTLVIKSVPNKRVHLYFHMPSLVIVDVDVTLACDDDHPIQAPKNTLFPEFVVLGLGIILEDLASSICSDENRTKGQVTKKLIPILSAYDFFSVLNFVLSFRVCT